MTDVSLKVNGQIYAGWKTARVTRSIESICGSFALGVSERWANQETEWPIREGDVCTVLLGEVPVITGYLDQRRLSFGTDAHTVEVTGRDKAADLVDCSAKVGGWEFRKITLLQFAQKLCGQFGISVSLQSGLTLPAPPEKFSISPGDTAFSTLEHACRLAGVLAVSDGLGGVVLMRGGRARCATALIEGENILSASAEFDRSGRFSQYLVLGQKHGTDQGHGSTVAAVKGEAWDIDVSRSERVLIIRPESGVTPAQASKRAEWEAITRAARGDTVTVTVQGWTQRDGTLWPVNQLVSISSPLIGIDGVMLISQATYSLDVENGSTTVLTLKRPDAFAPPPSATVPTGDHYWQEIENHGRGV